MIAAACGEVGRCDVRYGPKVLRPQMEIVQAADAFDQAFERLRQHGIACVGEVRFAVHQIGVDGGLKCRLYLPGGTGESSPKCGSGVCRYQ